MPKQNESYWWKDRQGNWHYHKKGTKPAVGSMATSKTKPKGESSASATATGTSSSTSSTSAGTRELVVNTPSGNLSIGASSRKAGVPSGTVEKDVTRLNGEPSPPKSTLPRKGSLGFQFGKKGKRIGATNLVQRLLKKKTNKGLGAYNITHKEGEPISALEAHRASKNKKSQFGGPKDGRKSGAVVSTSRGDTSPTSPQNVKGQPPDKSSLYTTAARRMTAKKKKRGLRP